MSDFAENNQQALRDDNQEIESLQRDLALAKEIQDSEREIRLLIKLGSNYYSANNYEQALKCYQESLSKAKEILTFI
jgi:tetratricopeptide (TPR) repeat protein